MPGTLFSEALQSKLLTKASVRTEPRGAVLFRRGEPSSGIYLVRKGSISLQLEAGGKTIWDRTVFPGAIIGLPSSLSEGRCSLTAVTLEECELAFVERLALIELMKSDPAVSLEVVHAVGEEVLRMREYLTQHGATVQ